MKADIRFLNAGLAETLQSYIEPRLHLSLGPFGARKVIHRRTLPTQRKKIRFQPYHHEGGTDTCSTLD